MLNVVLDVVSVKMKPLAISACLVTVMLMREYAIPSKIAPLGVIHAKMLHQLILKLL